MEIREGLSFRDVLLVPKYSDVLSRRNVETRTRLSTHISLNIPIVSSNMDTVTETEMAIKMAELGGIGIIHRFLRIDQQVEMVRKVKRSHNFVIKDPYTISYARTVFEAKQRMQELGVNNFLVIDPIVGMKLLGLISRRDILFQDNSCLVADAMTPFNELALYLLDEDMFLEEVDLNEIKTIYKKRKVEKFPVVSPDRSIRGLVAIKDIERTMKYPKAVKDTRGRLLVGGSIGVIGDYLERASELISAGVDIINIDIAHGHHKLLIEALEAVKTAFPDIDVIVGAVATSEGVSDLVNAGADSLRVGIGPGSHCTTRTVSGCGVPQLTALDDCCGWFKHPGEREDTSIPIIADGGIRGSDDIIKALAVGAESVILGRLLAGCKESPGVARLKDGKRIKSYRGMASYDAATDRSKGDESYSFDAISYIAEGVESDVPYQGPVEDVLAQLMGGVHSGMSYLGASTLKEVRENASFVKLTNAGWEESLTRKG